MAVANIVAETDDGYITGTDELLDYAAARSTSDSTNDTGTSMLVGQETDGINYSVRRCFMRFSLASLGGGTPTAYTLTMVAVGDVSVADFDVVIREYVWSTPLGTSQEANYDGLLAASAADDVVWRNTSGMSLNTAYTSPALTGLAASGGYIYLGLLSAEDVANSSPVSNERISIASASHGTAAFRPTLNVTYTPAAPTGSKAMSGQSKRARASWYGKRRVLAPGTHLAA